MAFTSQNSKELRATCSGEEKVTDEKGEQRWSYFEAI
jgi:hypothetical protein